MICVQKLFHAVEHQLVQRINGRFDRKTAVSVAYAVHRSEKTGSFLRDLYIPVPDLLVESFACKPVRVKHDRSVPAPDHFFFYGARCGVVSSARTA